MNPLLARQPMTPAAVASLVERVRVNSEIARAAGRKHAVDVRRLGAPRLAAQWAHEHKASFADAARLYDCSQHAVRYRYYRMYSGLRSVAR